MTSPIPNRSFANWGIDNEVNIALIETINNTGNVLLYLNKFEIGFVIKIIDLQREEFFIVSLDQLSSFSRLFMKDWFFII